MKNLAVVIVIPVVILLSALAWAGAEPNPADDTINVHVSSARVNGRGLIRLKVVLDGKKCELEGIDGESSLLTPGDYKARTIPLKVKDAHTYDVTEPTSFSSPTRKPGGTNSSASPSDP